LIAKNPNIRILIANSVLSNAKSFLREIKGHLERNEKLREIIGDQVNKSDKWTETEIIIKGRTSNLKEPTIQVAGVGQSLVSQHYDVIIGDDLVNTESVNTAEQIEKTKDWFKMALSLLEPNGIKILIGTRYHYGDLYGWLIKEFYADYNPQIHSVYNTDGTTIFPDRFSEDVINDIKRQQGSFLFSCQYLNNPVDDENAKFKKSNIKYLPELPNNQFYTTMVIDRAYSLAKTADYTGFTIKKQDTENFWYISLAMRVKAHEGTIVDLIFDLKEKFRVDKVGIEQKAFNDTLKPTLDEEMRRRGIFFEVVELKGRASKISRIESLVPRFESGSIFFVGEEKDFVDLEDELLRFPVAEHDDLADSLAYHNDEDMRGGVQTAKAFHYRRSYAVR
jgi:predicted phage terminase large subunit-like protein